MKNLFTSYFLRVIFCFTLFTFLLSGISIAQSQFLSGSGTSNFQRQKDSRIKQHPIRKHVLPGQLKTQKGSLANFHQEVLKKLPLKNSVKSGLSMDSLYDSTQVYNYFTYMGDCYYVDSSFLVPNSTLMFYTEIYTNYLTDSSNVNVTFDFGDGTTITIHPHNYYDSLYYYNYYFYANVFHAYISPGVYTPTCTVVTTAGDTSIAYLYCDTTISIHTGPLPVSEITDMMAYSEQWCDSLTFNYYGSLNYLNMHIANIQSGSDVFSFYTNFGDGHDTLVTKTFDELFWQYGYYYYWYWGDYWYYQPNYYHVYSLPGTYTMQTIVSFPDGNIDTAYASTTVGSICNTFQGSVFVDNNNNCIQDNGEQGVPYIYLNTSYYYNLDTIYYNNWDCYYYDSWAMTDQTGHYAFYIPDVCPISDTIFLNPYWNFYPLGNLPISCPASGYYPFNSDSSTYNNNFAFGCQTGYDLTGDIYGWRFRPGFQGYIYPFFGNLQCDSISGTASLVFDNPGYITIDSVVPAPIGIYSDSIVWSYNNLSILNWWDYAVVYIHLDTSATVGDTIHTTLTLNPIAGDNNPANNIIHAQFVVSNSWDPNEKEVFPKTDTPEGFIKPSQELTYFIHFQNTGSDTAYSIYVLDTIDSDLDLATFRVLTSSHYMEYTLNGNLIQFSFPYIMLVDSTTNVAASQGFVSYQIKPKYALAEGTAITNTAYIYFDYNPAVVTNSTLNTISYFTAVAESENNSTIKVFPNPATTELFIQNDHAAKTDNITICDMLGKEKVSVSGGSVLTKISIRDFAPGIYFLHCKNSKESTVFKIIIGSTK